MVLARHVAEVGRADHVVHVEQRMAGVAHRFFFVDVDRRLARTPRIEGGDERARLDQRRAAGVDDQRRRFHPREIASGHDAPRGVGEAHMKRNDVAFLEERLLAARYGVTVRASARLRRFARPYQDFHAKGLSVSRHDGSDPAVAEYPQGLSAYRSADAGLPLSGLEGSHLLGDVAQGGDDQSPGQLCGGVGGHAEMLVRGQDDAEACAGIDIDVGKDAALADEPEPGKALEQGGADLGALADQHQRLGVCEASGQRIGVLDVIVPDGDLVAGELAEGIQRGQRVVIVVEYGYFHDGYVSGTKSYSPIPCSTRKVAEASPPLTTR